MRGGCIRRLPRYICFEYCSVCKFCFVAMEAHVLDDPLTSINRFSFLSHKDVLHHIIKQAHGVSKLDMFLIYSWNDFISHRKKCKKK